MRYYVGSQNTSIPTKTDPGGKPCLNWLNVPAAKEYIGVNGVGDHNFCRKPEEDSLEFCYISHNSRIIKQNCKVRTCGKHIGDIRRISSDPTKSLS